MKTIISKDLFDTNASTYVLSCLMHKPLLLQDDRYTFCKTDFYKPLQQMVFYAIYNMAQIGVSQISPQDVDLHLKQFNAQYEYYKNNKGYEFVIQCYQMTEVADENLFDFYYGRLKKFSLLRDLESIGYDTSEFYDTNANALNKDIEDEKLNKLNIGAIGNRIREHLVEIENKHIGKTNNTSQNAAQGLRQLVKDLQEKPEVGLPLEGDIVNFAARGARLGKLYTYSAPSGMGKALPNNILIPMFDGSWKQVKDVCPGDYLIDRHGNATRVLQIFPQGLKDVYKITFKDGRVAYCNDEHLWTYHNVCARDYLELETKTLREIINIVKDKGYRSDGAWRFSVPFNQPVNYPSQSLAFDPYLLGLLLGDGCFREQPNNRNLKFSDSTGELVQNFQQLGWTIHRNSLSNYTYTFKDIGGKNIHIREFCEQYQLQSLYNKLTEDKIIPQEYLIGSVDQRLSLLQGLLDTGGIVDLKGCINFNTINITLAKQVQQLCWSLGLICVISTDKRHDKYTTGVCYNLHITGTPEIKIQFFRYSYKKQRLEQWMQNSKCKEKNIYNPIIDISATNTQEEMTCFLVDNAEHLFLMNDFIVTHNTRYMTGQACAISFPYIDRSGKIIYRGTVEQPDYQKVLYIATEQKADEIQTLILAYVSGVNERSILLGNYTPEELDRVNKALDIIDKYKDNFIIEYMSDPSIAQVKTIMAKYIIQEGVSYIFYDYIFSSPGLLSEFRDVEVREDVALMMLSNSLKETAANYNVFIQSATQLNDGWSRTTIGSRDQNCLRGSKAIADKIDIGMIGVQINPEEFQQVEAVWEELRRTDPNKYIQAPNIVVDIYKNRRGELNHVKVFRYFDYATCHCQDLFITDSSYKAIQTIGQLKYDRRPFDYLDLKTRGIL